MQSPMLSRPGVSEWLSFWSGHRYDQCSDGVGSTNAAFPSEARMVDLVGIEPTTSSIPFPSKRNVVLRHTVTPNDTKRAVFTGTLPMPFAPAGVTLNYGVVFSKTAIVPFCPFELSASRSGLRSRLRLAAASQPLKAEPVA